MGWFYVLIGGLFEVGWAYGLRASEGFTKPVASVVTIITLAISFYLFAKAMRMLEIGTAYAVYTGIGTAGTAIVGMLVLGEPADALRIFFVALLVGGIIGIKLVSEDGDKKDASREEPDAS
ncbi:quaternary ammonium compound-resistance protein SugE [Paenibacillus phyllosphaerae]|uniref:Quaternary ammonium compound-resistance protein SugE n=1 Tax=Paenibacillus phyllosphaerae TaxID=274593 RepID=A0A7W5FMU8_9BACL|nr:multidrug efflux SMR transporter [Paenibacillus phyllosphaerae]MBB3110620.1 quaternary ammonium compound-resistance protein SugE [Paenibacillus phyllosphaerae]